MDAAVFNPCSGIVIANRARGIRLSTGSGSSRVASAAHRAMPCTTRTCSTSRPHPVEHMLHAPKTRGGWQTPAVLGLCTLSWLAFGHLPAVSYPCQDSQVYTPCGPACDPPALPPPSHPVNQKPDRANAFSLPLQTPSSVRLLDGCVWCHRPRTHGVALPASPLRLRVGRPCTSPCHQTSGPARFQGPSRGRLICIHSDIRGEYSMIHISSPYVAGFAPSHPHSFSLRVVSYLCEVSAVPHLRANGLTSCHGTPTPPSSRR